MGGHSKRSCTSYETIPATPPPPQILRVSGNPEPDVRGDYLEDGLFSGRMSYRLQDGDFYIWWDDVKGYYCLSEIKGNSSEMTWVSPREYIIATYTPLNEDVTGDCITTFI